jgi:hypothetical protein
VFHSGLPGPVFDFPPVAGVLVELLLDESLTGWRVQAEVHQEPEGWIRVQNFPGTVGTQLTPLASFSPPFVVEVEFAFPPNGGYGNWAGVMFGPADSRAVYDQGLERRMFVNCCSEYLSAQVGEGHKGRQTHRIGKNASHRVQVKLWPGRIQMCHNGTLYVDDATLPPDSPARFTLGERVPALGPNVFKCRNIRIRRSSDDPPPPPEMRPDRPATGEMQSQPEA